ncbi:hypothetical protein KP509_28G067800 [Ceratopteris richardii]|uniref:Uncharacterized protein n=2 Tax=Ceratopteris richardii TaxID=49495 RepID=A0A8T2RFL8_CERRI|nr:hypothetical protein KP509_28G067800 [Ceratopteris richardii]KAH7294353.1 hypothetical protein KP509_28G067800 [Ceratopteris richardii]KAH7294355.1 hypothetical protein KP509_28G067800 [Ceratopteris richardii]
MEFDEGLLSSYLVENLRPLTEADPNLLARFVTALLKKNKPKQELEALCIEELFEFLGDDSEVFVRDLFHAFENGILSIFKKDPDINVGEVMSTIPLKAPGKAIDDVIRVTDDSACLDMERLPELENGVCHYNEDDEATDDEDDDRNHKHKRRMNISNFHDGNGAIQKSLMNKNDKSQIVRQPSSYSKNISGARNNKGLHMPHNRKKDALSERVSYHLGSIARHGGEKNRHFFPKRHSILPGNGIEPMFGCHRVGAPLEPWITYDYRNTLDGISLNPPIMSLGSFDPCFGRSISTVGRQGIEFGQYPVVKNSHQSDNAFLNHVRQGSFGIIQGASSCPDFEERGYCLRGDLCPMEHGANRIVVADFQSLSKLNLPLIPSTHQQFQTSGSSSTTSQSSCSSNPVPVKDQVPLMVDEQIFCKGQFANFTSEADVYDPEQPFLNKEQASGLRSELSRQLMKEDRKNVQGASTVLKQISDHGPDENNIKVFSFNDMKHELPREKAVEKDARLNCYGVAINDENNGQQRSFFKAGTEVLVEGYEPECVSDVHENGFKEEILDKSKGVDAGGVTDQKRNSGLYCVGLKSYNKSDVGSEGERASRTLYVGFLPKVKNKKNLLKIHFQKFGEIVDIRVPSQGDTAFVQFSRQEEAEAALQSPEAVMGNRFIRVSWAKRDSVPFSAAGYGFAVPAAGHKRKVDPEDSEGILCENMSVKFNRATCKSPESKHKSVSVKTAIPSCHKKQQELELMVEELRKKQDELAQKREDFRRQLERYSKQGIRVTGGSHSDKSTNLCSEDAKTQPKEAAHSTKESSSDKVEARIDESLKGISALSASVDEPRSSSEQSDASLLKDTIKLCLDPVHSSSVTCPSGELISSLSSNDAELSGSSEFSPRRDKCGQHTT